MPVVDRKALWAIAWTAPMVELAAHAGVSNVYMKRELVALGLPIPPRGHWNKVRAGRPGASMPRQPRRKVGESEEVSIGGVVGNLFVAATPPPLAIVEDDWIAELRAAERAAIEKLLTASSARRPGGKRKALMANPAEAGTDRHQPLVVAPDLDDGFRRRAKVLNTIFYALRHRGHDVAEEDAWGASVTINGIAVALRFDVRGIKRWLTHGDAPGGFDRSPMARMRVRSSLRGDWRDDRSGPLEGRVAEVVAGLVVEAETERRRRDAEARRLEASQFPMRDAELEQALVAKLVAAAHASRDAEAIRALLIRAGRAGTKNLPETSVAALPEWLAWAQRQAERLDPITSGAIADQLRQWADSR